MGARASVGIAVVLASMAAGGCVTPVALSRGLCAVGIYSVSSSYPNPLASYTRIEGVGLAIRRGSVACGYQRWETVEALPTGDYAITTPLVRLAVGRAAEGPQGWAILHLRSAPRSPDHDQARK